MKDFKQEFDKFLNMIESGENFAFARFSDGELYMMQNKKAYIRPNEVFIRGAPHPGSWGPEELKEFNPETDQFYREKLIECFKFTKENYFKGICFSEDVGKEDYEWQFEMLGNDSTWITWSNLLINGNYADFIERMVPEFVNKPIVYICNEIANVDKLPFDVKKDFRIGQNCHVNDYPLIETVKDWMMCNNINDHIFLFSAASLSNYMIHDLYKENSNNTYLDIGSTLNPLMDMTGWLGSRQYLRGYWLKENNPYINMIGKWG